MDELEPFFEKLGGIIPVIGTTFVPMTANELKEIETHVGFSLPKTYSEFLLKYGASTFPEIVEFHPIAPLPSSISEDGTGDFGSFYGASSKSYFNSLWLSRAIETYRDRMPKSVIPIADCSGNKICIGLKGKEQGKIYYWDHNNEWDEDGYMTDYGKKMPAKMKFQNLHLIAESFEDFIRRLSIDKTL